MASLCCARELYRHVGTKPPARQWPQGCKPAESSQHWRFPSRPLLLSASHLCRKQHLGVERSPCVNSPEFVLNLLWSHPQAAAEDSGFLCGSFFSILVPTVYQSRQGNLRALASEEAVVRSLLGPEESGTSAQRSKQASRYTMGTDVTRASWFWQPSARRCSNRSQILLSPWVLSFYCTLGLTGPLSACLTLPQPLGLCPLHTLTCCPHHYLLELPWLVLCRVLGALGTQGVHCL